MEIDTLSWSRRPQPGREPSWASCAASLREQIDGAELPSVQPLRLVALLSSV